MRPLILLMSSTNARVTVEQVYRVLLELDAAACVANGILDVFGG
jgi:hypothetical protein